jgi:hypothetical protein
MPEKDFYLLIILSTSSVLWSSGSLEPGVPGVERAAVWNEKSQSTWSLKSSEKE